MNRITFDPGTKAFSSVMGTKMFGDNDKKKKNDKKKGGGGGYDGPKDNSGLDPHRMRLTNFKYNERGHKAVSPIMLAKLRRLNEMLSELYEGGIIADFFPTNNYTGVYVACQEGKYGSSGADCFISLEQLNGTPTYTGPSTSGSKYLTMFRDPGKGTVIADYKDLSLDELRQKLYEASSNTPDQLERMWRATKKGLGVAKWIGKRIRDYFDESPIHY